MQPNDVWEELLSEEYCIYLQSLDEDDCPMDLEAFEWIKIREIEEDRAELYEPSPVL